MQTYSVRQGGLDAEMLAAAAEVLRGGGLVGFPCGSSYRIAADVLNTDAVLKLYQSKRRTSGAPALVFVADGEMLSAITGALDPVSQRLISSIWPGNLTILVDPKLDLPRRILKLLTKSRQKIGVRVPAGALAQGIVREFGGPLLVSSANLQKKKGAYSLAQVRKNFLHSLDLFFDAGDLQPSPPSTVVDVCNGAVSVVRAGAITEDELVHATGD